jgi:tetratricopeptide (TPR) repeat protein
MKPVAFLRTLAILLLRFAIWIAPHDTLDWGRGILSELNYVEGNWSALMWAFGGAGVLAKHAMLALVLPGSHRRTVASASELFAKEIPMRKATLTATAACVAACLLFFLAPVFRQAFQVSLAQWHDILHVNQRWQGPGPDSELEGLAKKAEQNHDAEALAFVAIRHWDPSESVRLAEEAVHVDPSLTWVYGVIAAQYSSFPQFDRWVSDLEKYDPQNALPYFIVAEKVDVDINEVVRKTNHPVFVKGIGSGRDNHESPVWQTPMAAAFLSPKLDTYVDRVKALDREILQRYHVDDPFQAMNDEYSWWSGLPTYSSWDSSLYAQSILEAGEALEARGDREGALEKYSAVARFGQMMGSASAHLWLQRVDQQAYQRLASLSEQGTNKEQAQLYTELAYQADQMQKAEMISMRSRFSGADVSEWNAFLVRVSGIVLLFSFGLLLACVVGVIARGKSLRPSMLRPSPLTLALGFVGAIGALLSSAVLYAAYRPYAEILQQFVSRGDESGLSELSNFLGATQVPLGTRSYLGVYDAVFHFWGVVTALCALALLIAVFRHFHHHRPAATSV